MNQIENECFSHFKIIFPFSLLIPLVRPPFTSRALYYIRNTSLVWRGGVRFIPARPSFTAEPGFWLQMWENSQLGWKPFLEWTHSDLLHARSCFGTKYTNDMFKKKKKDFGSLTVTKPNGDINSCFFISLLESKASFFVMQGCHTILGCSSSKKRMWIYKLRASS